MSHSGEYLLVITWEKGIRMQSRAWIINISFLVIFVINLFFVFFSRVDIPKRTKMEPTGIIQPSKKESAKVDITRIYTNDLFNTYVKPVEVEKAPEPTIIQPIPLPPEPKSFVEEKPLPPSFLEALPLKLKGVILSNDEKISQAIIANTKTLEEKLYSNGDKIEDSYVLRILPNKVILIRSNGQQESIFINPLSAKAEMNILQSDSWAATVQPISDYEYIVDPKEFVGHIAHLAQFIDTLDLTTVFKKGESIGCRIGRIGSQSIGSAFKINLGNIILSINNIPLLKQENG